MNVRKKEYYTNGNISYEIHYKDELIHRDNLSAIIQYCKNVNIYFETYCKEGKVHRENGPAVIYYINGKISEEIYYLLDGKQYKDKDIIDNWEVFCKMQIFR